MGGGHSCVSETGIFWKRGLFRKVHFLENMENLEILEILENPQTVEKQRRIRPFSRDSREFRGCGDSKDSCSEKTPFVMTPCPIPDCGLSQKTPLPGLIRLTLGSGRKPTA